MADLRRCVTFLQTRYVGESPRLGRRTGGTCKLSTTLHVRKCSSSLAAFSACIFMGEAWICTCVQPHCAQLPLLTPVSAALVGLKESGRRPRGCFPLHVVRTPPSVLHSGQSQQTHTVVHFTTQCPRAIEHDVIEDSGTPYSPLCRACRDLNSTVMTVLCAPSSVTASPTEWAPPLTRTGRFTAQTWFLHVTSAQQGTAA